MGFVGCLCPSKPYFLQKFKQGHFSTLTTPAELHTFRAKSRNLTAKGPFLICSNQSPKVMTILIGATGITLIPFLGSSYAAESGIFSEPFNALSLPTWTVHVSSVIEWAAAMALVWQYGEKSGYESWKGLSWGMVPLLAGALCACTWHFFYNSESLEILVALQAALTVVGNVTMCIAAYRIYVSSQKSFKDF